MEILITEKSKDYELLDSGDEEKLERFGKFILRRPEPQAIWSKSLPDSEWQKADASYTRDGETGKWQKAENFLEMWRIELEGLTFNIKLLPSKHLGVFPEQSSHWDWLRSLIKDSSRDVKVLNLFGYTGGASLASSKAGAKVVHVDASQFVVDAAHKNYLDSGLKGTEVRFIVDDVRKFVEREIKRGNKYDVILLDPPVYGKGNQKQKQKQIWKIEEDLMPLLLCLKNLLSTEPLAIIINGYSSLYSHITYAQMLSEITKGLGGKISSGELAIKESASGKLLPSGIFVCWEK